MNTVVQAIALTGLVSCTQDTSVVGQKAKGPVDAGDTGDGTLDDDADDTGEEGDLSTPCAADAGDLPRGEEGTLLSQVATVSAKRSILVNGRLCLMRSDFVKRSPLLPLRLRKNRLS